jgi:hypothetical protein
MRRIGTNEVEGIILYRGKCRVKKINMAVWGAVLFLLGLCFTAAATGESEPLADAALPCTSTLAVSASFLLNLLGVNGT